MNSLNEKNNEKKVSNENESKKSGKLTKLKNLPTYAKVSIAVVSVIMVCLGSVAFIINHKLNKVNRNFVVSTIEPKDEVFDDDTIDQDDELHDDTLTPEVTKAAAPVENTPANTTNVPATNWPDNVEIMKDPNVVNIMLIGEDRKRGQSSCRSDTMMLLTINKNTSELKLTSFLRDSYVQIPGYSDNKLNAAYAFGGVDLMDKAFKKNFGLIIDGHIAINFTDFKEIINELGGVNIKITKQEASYLRKKGYSVYEGSVDMNGSLALEYSRIRKIDSDFYRTARQRKVLSTIFKKLKKKSLVQLYSISDEILPLVKTDLSNSEILEYIKYINSLDIDELESYRIPVDGTYTNSWVRKMSVVKLNLPKNREKLKEYLYN